MKRPKYTSESKVHDDRLRESELLFRSRIGFVFVSFAIASGLFLAWQTAVTLLLIFAGLLVAALLDACTRGLQHLLPLGRGACFLIVFAVGSVIILMSLTWGGYTIVQQWDELYHIVGRQLSALGDELARLGVKTPGPKGDRLSDEQIAQFLLPDPAGLFGQARSALGAAGNVLLVLFNGFFVGLNPGAYQRAIESIFPRSHRCLVSEVIDGMAETLRWWLVGQLFTMLVITLSIAIALWFLGMPGSMLLGLQAGLMNFIPYLGPVLGAVPITLAVTSQGTSMVIWMLAIYVVIQILEGYVLTPLVQRRAVDVQPALALAAQMLMGVLFGAVGIALATPLLAVARVAVIHLSADEADEH